MTGKPQFILWGVVTVLLVATIVLQIQVITFTREMQNIHPVQAEKLEELQQIVEADHVASMAALVILRQDIEVKCGP